MGKKTEGDLTPKYTSIVNILLLIGILCPYTFKIVTNSKILACRLRLNALSSLLFFKDMAAVLFLLRKKVLIASNCSQQRVSTRPT